MVNKTKEGLLMARRGGQRPFRLLALGNVFNHTNKIVKPVIGLADSADGLIYPDRGAVFADQAFVGGILIEFSGRDFLVLGEFCSEIGRMGDFPDGELPQGFLRVVQYLAELWIHAKEVSGLGRVGNSYRRLFKSRAVPLFTFAQRLFEGLAALEDLLHVDVGRSLRD